MQRHESYKPSGVKWLGAVPSHWEILALRAVTQLKSDRNRPDLPVLSVMLGLRIVMDTVFARHAGGIMT